jgi:hypothetical protein
VLPLHRIAQHQGCLREQEQKEEQSCCCNQRPRRIPSLLEDVDEEEEEEVEGAERGEYESKLVMSAIREEKRWMK